MDTRKSANGLQRSCRRRLTYKSKKGEQGQIQLPEQPTFGDRVDLPIADLGVDNRDSRAVTSFEKLVILQCLFLVRHDGDRELGWRSSFIALSYKVSF